MAMILVTSQKMKNAAENLAELNRQFKTKEEELVSKEQVLCQMWEGKAKDAFRMAFERDNQQMDTFYGLINRYIQTLLEIAERYEQAEARNAEIAANRRY